MIRRTIARIMAVLLCSIFVYGCAWAEAVPAQPGAASAANSRQTERVLPGVDEPEYEETPEDIIVAGLEVYSWFTISPLDIDTGLMLPDGSAYRVADESLCSYDVIISLLKTMFSDEIIADMFSYEMYTVLDGIMYTTAGGGRMIDENIASVEYEEVSADEQKTVYNVTVHYHAANDVPVEADVFEFVREKIEGRWLFTQFTFFW